MVIRVVVLSLLLAGCAQNAAQPTAMAAGTTTASAAPAVAKEKKICRSDTELGSIMSHRTCRTAAEWAAIDEANSQNAQRALEDRQRGAAERPQ